MRRNWRSNRLVFIFVCILICTGLITLSSLGLLRPVEGFAAAPINFITGVLNSFTRSVNSALNDTSDVDALRERVRVLEEQLALVTAELIQAREIVNDYDRLTGLLEYNNTLEDTTFVTADVIGYDQQASVRSIFINRGTRDGIGIGMPVVTDLGLVGRIYNVTANTAQIQLVTDPNSSVSGRLETSRAEGAVIGRGLETGNLVMRHIPIDREIVRGDLVFTSGRGGNFPPDIVIGQVTSFRNFEFELSQEAQVSSLIDFSTLEFVQVITSFEPADLSAFDES